MKKILKNNIVIVGLTFFIPGIVSLLIKNTFSMYKSLVLPKLAPPGILFPIIWSILYVLMSISIIRVKDDDKNIIIYYVQLVLNAIWPLIFFLFKNYLLALMELIVLFIVVIYMSYLYKNDDNISFYLLIPYIVWLSFAFYLNTFVYLYN